MTATIWLALSLACAGHTNARCWFKTESFLSREACVNSILVDEESCGFPTCKPTGRKIIPPESMCLPLAGPPVTSSVEKNGR